MATTSEIDLKQFCDQYERRQLDEPRVQEGWLYASDGAILVRVPSDEPDFEWKGLPLNLGHVCRDLPPENPKPWPSVNLIDGIGCCVECEGYGKVSVVECEMCEGTGIDECPHCQREEDCEECDGEGVIGEKCGKCNGQGRYLHSCIQVVGELRIKAKYDRMIRSLPNVRFSVENEVVIFEFDGGQGIVMPTVERS